MRWGFALLLVACASSPPPRPATDVAVGSEEWNRIDLVEWAIELPADALANVQIAWREGPRRAQLSLTGASLGSSVERMADDEANAMRALDGESSIQRRRLRVAEVVGIGLQQGPRDVVVAMRNPWRALRLAVWGGSAEPWLAARADVVGVRLDPQWALHEARFESDAYVITSSRGDARGETIAERAGWTLRVHVKTSEPDLDRIRESFVVR